MPLARTPCKRPRGVASTIRVVGHGLCRARRVRVTLGDRGGSPAAHRPAGSRFRCAKDGYAKPATRVKKWARSASVRADRQINWRASRPPSRSHDSFENNGTRRGRASPRPTFPRPACLAAECVARLHGCDLRTRSDPRRRALLQARCDSVARSAPVAFRRTGALFGRDVPRCSMLRRQRERPARGLPVVQDAPRSGTDELAIDPVELSVAAEARFERRL